MTNNTATHVIVGLSGGVDSAVAALLLKQQGYQVSAVFMQNWEAEVDDPYCTFTQDLEDAKQVAKTLDIPLQVVNFSREYWQKVFDTFLNEYAAGRTPNPDVLCNKEIKFKAFLNYALEQGADFIATGHYCNKNQTKDGVYHLIKAKDQNKDQTYFLYLLNQWQLQHSMFPLGDLDKNEVRKIAEEAGFTNFAKKDSTGICFIGERKFKEFLNEYLLKKPGEIVDTEGNILGRHDGLMFYTLGQRQGLGIGGKKDRPEKPWYVITKDFEQSRLIIDQDQNHPFLMSRTLTCNQVHWIGSQPKLPLQGNAKIRYRQQEQVCTIKQLASETLEVEFDKPQRAIAPGQSVVFYSEDECLGGGIIRDISSKQMNFS